MAHLTTLGLFPTDITTSHNQELHGHLDRTEQHTAKLEVADRRTAQATWHRGLPGRILTCHPVGWATVRVLWTDEAGEVSTVTVAVTKDKETLSAPVAQTNAGNNAATLTSLTFWGRNYFF